MAAGSRNKQRREKASYLCIGKFADTIDFRWHRGVFGCDVCR